MDIDNSNNTDIGLKKLVGEIETIDRNCNINKLLKLNLTQCPPLQNHSLKIYSNEKQLKDPRY